MMFPDREAIIRTKLASVGYTSYQKLATKFTMLYAL